MGLGPVFSMGRHPSAHLEDTVISFIVKTELISSMHLISHICQSCVCVCPCVVGGGCILCNIDKRCRKSIIKTTKYVSK